MKRSSMMLIPALALAVLVPAAAQSAQLAAVTQTPELAPAASPYTANVPVAGTGDAQRNAAIGAALALVLQQVAPGVNISPDVLANAAGYVRNYSYRRSGPGTMLELQVDFDPGSISRIVAQAQTLAAAPAPVPVPMPPPPPPGTGLPASVGVAPPALAANGKLTLWVHGFGDARAFTDMLAQLRDDTMLDEVTPVATEGDGVLLRVASKLPLPALLRTLTTADGHLLPDLMPHPGANASLRWLP